LSVYTTMSVPFQYQPIDQQSTSIRLIRLRKEKSLDGHVQCNIRHASTEASYVCLSYVWGDDDECYTILINGRFFEVRHNLHRFLIQARRSKYLSRMWIWIDALCINQNDSSERNHQVQQMGLIFSRAKNVTSWLGDERHIARFLLHVRRRAIHEDHTQDSRKAVLERPGQPPGFHYFCVAEYWNRAWITQEVALARRITLMAANIELDGSLYPVLSEWGEGYLARLEHLRPKNTAKWKGRSLVYLMDKFKLKESRIRRDRVYSLLALCGDGKDLQVDYDATDQTVAKDILRCCKQSFCLCTVNTVAFILQLHPRDRDDIAWNSGLQPFAVMTLPVLSKTTSEITCSSSRPCPYRSCDGREQSHLPGFVVSSPSCTFLSIHLYLGRICSAYGTSFVKIDGMAAAPGFICQWSLHGSGEGGLSQFIVPHYDCSWLLTDNGKSCTVMFSLGLLVEIAQIGRTSSSGLCARVADVGTQSSPFYDDPVMQMHFWDPSRLVA
jgi:hypothetical protein